ncbi:hypothetical protein IWX64_002347 [Arthrobacter sp. CAN_A212]|uniref:hypothetical protein n=1 Tax=Arthrobacter sp. CAN_A212 TaxID=2787719 RepID=UPI0018CA030F
MPSLLDTLTPLLGDGTDLGDFGDALDEFTVDDAQNPSNPGGITVTGTVSFAAGLRLGVDVVSKRLVWTPAATAGGEDAFGENSWIDVRNTTLAFELQVPGLDGEDFTLDLSLSNIVLKAPFLRGARHASPGELVPDPQNPEVTFTLPDVEFQIFGAAGATDAKFLGLGNTGTDDPAIAAFVTMQPPFAFIGSTDVVGFGFRSGLLDLSGDATPPAVLDLLNLGAEWQGLYLPEIRLFVAPNGARDLCVDAGARNLLIGFGETSGVSGDFDLTVAYQGAGALRLGARFYDAAGRCYSPEGTGDTRTVTLPPLTRMVADVDGGLAPFTFTISIDDVAQATGRVADIDLSADASQRIVITVRDGSGTPQTATLTLTTSALASVPGGGTNARLRTLGTTTGSVPAASPRLRIDSETAAGTTTTVVLALDVDTAAAATIEWRVNGGTPTTGPTLSVPVGPGQRFAVQARLPGSSTVGNATAYYRFDTPDPGAEASAQSRSAPAPNAGATTPWTAGTDTDDTLRPLLAALPTGHPVTIRGYASFEGADTPTVRQYNERLARRRADALQLRIERLCQEPALAGRNPSITASADMAGWTSQGPALNVRRTFWKAEATWPPVTTGDTLVTAELWREETTGPGTDLTTPDSDSGTRTNPPSWFRKLGTVVRIVRNTFVSCEVFGEFDIQTPAENRLAGEMTPGREELSAARAIGRNPADGIIRIRFLIEIDEAVGSVKITAQYGAHPEDTDGLYLWGIRPGEPLQDPEFGLDFFGATVVLMPLLSETAGAVANEGGIAQMGVTAAMLGIPAAIAATRIVKTERVVWHGGEVLLNAVPGANELVVLFDIEAAISMNIFDLVTITREAPLTVRYKAVGIRLGDGLAGQPFQFRPVFDASKGYSIDVSGPGGLNIAEPLGELLQVLGARVARNNPLIFEIDLGFAVDLGVVSIDRARLRVAFEPFTFAITAFGASIDIPGALAGKGYLELSQTEVKGQLDLTLVPVSVRIAAGVGVANISVEEGGPATGVIVTLEVEFPVAIPLGQSGIGIYGFMGLFAMNYSRDMTGIDTSNMAPALAWLRATGGNPLNVEFWKPEVNAWAFGVGAILGTMGSSVIFNLKGLIMLELPGPRLLLIMKAKLLAVMPALGGNAEGVFLAVIDLDMGRGTLTIGISIDFSISPLLELHIPVEAFFNFTDVADWHLYLGRQSSPIHANILEVFDGTGYLMISGNGLALENLPEVYGFSIGTGLHVSFEWGDRSSGLYAELAAGFDAVVGFDPFCLAGILYVRGSLHLFIIEVSAWAKLEVFVGEKMIGGNPAKVSRISGEICGRVKFLFFSVQGCVTFELGETVIQTPPPPPLVEMLKLVGRSPALVQGSGVDKPIDSGLADAAESLADLNPGMGVPLDAIPVLMMNLPPVPDPATRFKGEVLAGSTGVAPGGWVKKGSASYKFTLTSVTLDAVDPDDGGVLPGGFTDGSTPATWWAQKSGDTALSAQLALLSWLPEGTPKAVETGYTLEESVTDSWGTICDPLAPPTSVLFTFLGEPLGPSDAGWHLAGTPWPDPPGSHRSTPPATQLSVTERWRSGDFSVDSLLAVVPAQVEGLAVSCPEGGDPHRTASIPAGTDDGENPVLAAIGGKEPEDTVLPRIDWGDLITKPDPDLTVHRAQLLDGVPIEQGRAKCSSRALAAPVYDAREPMHHGDDERKQDIHEGWKATGFQPGPLDNAVVLHTGPFAQAVLFLLVRRELLEGGLVVCTYDADENELSREPVTPAATSLPPRWTDVAGPWSRDAFLLRQQATAMARLGYLGVLVDVKGDEAADHVQIGMPPEEAINERLDVRGYYVAGTELTTFAEYLRYDWDQRDRGSRQGAIANVLGGDTDDHALLHPATVYRATVGYSVQARPVLPDGSDGPAADVPSSPQEFFFRTDNLPPRRLDPWILGSTPQEGEQHFPTGEPIRIIFGTTNVVRMFAAYGKRLQVRLRSSAFRPIQAKPGFAHPLVLLPWTPGADTNPDLVAAAVLSPWEQALAGVLTGSCIPVDEERVRHSVVTVGVELESYTDYIMDVEIADLTSPDGAQGEVIWRRSFSTGAFTTVDEFSGSFADARIAHRYAAPGALQNVAASFAARPPEGAELDQALSLAGLEPMGVPRSGQIVVFWETAAAAGSIPQPAAVLLDASEPMWRSRAVAVEEVDSAVAGNRRYTMVQRRWLELAEGASPDAIVDRIVQAPGGQRALISLKAGSRGKRLSLVLDRLAQPETYLDGPTAADIAYSVADLLLTTAPWEETDRS